MYLGAWGGSRRRDPMAALRADPPPPVCRWGRRPHREATACRLLERDDSHQWCVACWMGVT